MRGADKRWNFFFGNIDPYRIPINSEFQCDFVPKPTYWRIDPYDNQCGEAEYDDRGLSGDNVDPVFRTHSGDDIEKTCDVIARYIK